MADREDYRLVVTLLDGHQFDLTVRSFSHAKAKAQEIAQAGGWEEGQGGINVFYPAHRIASVSVEPHP